MRHTYYTCDKCGKVMKGKGVQICFYPIWDKTAGFDPEKETVSAVSEGETLELCEECCGRVFDRVYEEKK